MAQDGRVAGGFAARQQHRAGGCDLAQEDIRVEGPVQQNEHARPQQRQQPPGQTGLVPVGRQPSAAPSRPRVPVSAKAISRSVGYPAKPIR